MRSDIKLVEYDTVGSTNAEAKAYALRAIDTRPVLFVAREQSAGRGRLGRSFISRRGQGIYMSLLYYTSEPLLDAVSVTTRAAVAAAKAIENATGEPMRIKWVNDIYDRCGKVSGILVETLGVGELTAIVVGIGINTGEEAFPEELRGIASSIGEIGEEQRRAIIDDIVDKLIDGDDQYMSEYRKRFMLEGAHVDLLSAGEIIGDGVVLGVSDDGGLIFLRDGESEPEIIRTGEVSVRNIKRG